MITLPIKRLSFRMWLQILAIWTLVAVSMTTQMYLNSRLTNPDLVWIKMLLKQLPTWYLCALLTAVIMFFYDRYPLDANDWKRNLVRQAGIALVILLIFSNFRLWAMAYIVDRDVTQFTTNTYINFYLSQLAWDLAVYILIMVSIFADKSNSKRRKNEVYAATMKLRNQELENELNAAQLEALKLQLSPHFLFNTLNTVNALIRTQENTKAIQINTKLGDFLRTTLYTNHEQFVSLKEELQFVDLYLDIELLRFSDRLKIKKEISDESLNISIPHFILLPVIENAIKHGIAKNADAELITIKTQLYQGYLKIEVYNEGAFLSDHWTLENTAGIGLKNVSQRLAKIYNEKARFSIYNHTDKQGVQVLITIPVNE